MGVTAHPFLWGVATAAHQTEGGNVNSDYWVLEHLPDTYFKASSGDACDSLHRWREDLALIKSAGLNCYRFSIEWARIEPRPGEFSAAALAHYRRICLAARELGLEPVITFQHFTAPRWIAGQGGWENPATADRFAAYCEHATRALRGAFNWACTVNEPNGQVVSYLLRRTPWTAEPVLRAEAARRVGSDRFQSYFLGDSLKVRDVCLIAHAKGRDAIKSVAPEVRVGMTLDLQDFSPGAGGEALYRRVYDESRAPFYEAARNDDFLGVQPYMRYTFGPEGLIPADPAGERNQWGQTCPPDVAATVAREAHAAAGVPIIVTENGIDTLDDAQRIRFTRASVEALSAEVDRGLPLHGYIHWTLMDDYSWSAGYAPRFGMCSVNRTTFRRTPKPSLAAYRALIGDMKRKHRWASGKSVAANPFQENHHA